MTINRNNKPMDHFPEVVSLLSTGMTQKAVANSLHIRPAAVSEMDIIRKQCPWAFIAPFVTIRVPLSKLHGFARVLRRRGLRRSDKDMVEVTAVLQAKAKEYRDAALAAIKKGTFAPKEDSLDAFQPVPPPVEWYRSCNLSGIDDVGNPTGLCADERFRAQFRKAYRPPEDFASAKEWLDAITAK